MLNLIPSVRRNFCKNDILIPLLLAVLVLSLLSLLMPPLTESAGYELIPAAVHLDSSLSGAPLPPEEIVRKVRNAGMKVAIFGDKDNNRLEYGVLPLRNIIKKTVERESVIHYGASQYLEYLNEVALKNPDMVILPGIETVPFYYWEGSVFSGLKIRNFHKNILVFGLEKASDYENLPSVAYKKPRVFSIGCFINLWPLLLAAIGVFGFLYKRRYDAGIEAVLDEKEKRPFKKSGLILTVIGLIFTVNNFPFCPPLFDQYHGDKGSAPYQNLIDYVNSKGGMTFWSSPDVDYATYKYGPVTFETSPYYHELLNTKDYTGFAVFAEGMKHTGIPGGVWDQVLIEYINGKRKKPVWAIGELDYEEGDWMGETQTVFMVRDNTKAEILSALRSGKMYAVMGNPREQKPVLEHFQIWDELKQRWVEMGETAAVKGVTRMRIKITVPPGAGDSHVLKVIREGDVIKSINIKGSFEETIETDYQKQDGMTYYRLAFNGTLISNPIFCDFRHVTGLTKPM